MLRRHKVLASQIPFFWEAIKKAAVEANEVQEKDMPIYLNHLLHSLLNDKHQCFIQLDENRVLLGIVITQISFNKVTGVKELNLSTAYAWEKAGGDERMKDLLFIRDFAKKSECTRITLGSRNPVVWNMCQRIGWPEVSRNFAMEV